MKMWIGNEKEGEFKGIKTLFVGDPFITINDIQEISKYQSFKQIYFGAGVCTIINQDVVRKSIELFPKHIITLEIDYKDLSVLSEDILNNYNIYFIITITHKGFSKLNHLIKKQFQIKIQSLDETNGEKYLALAKLENFDKVDISQLRKKTYKGDKVLK